MARGKDEPNAIAPLRRRDDLDLDAGRRERRDFLGHTIGDSREHGSSSAQDNVRIQVLPDVDITPHDAVIRRLVNADAFNTEHARLEQALRAPESLRADRDDLPVRQLKGLLQSRRGQACLELRLVVQRDVSQLLFNLSNNFTLSRRGERVPPLGQDRHHVLSEIPSSHI